jgi:4-oxalmesaconate hydratase
MIIDCHGHYTTEPGQLHAFRDRQLAALADASRKPANLDIADDQIRESLENAQLKFQCERGTDVTIFSPRASGMAHHVGTPETSRE